MIGERRSQMVSRILFRGAAIAPSHGENRGSSPLGSANSINDLHFKSLLVSRPCPVGILGSRA